MSPFSIFCWILRRAWNGNVFLCGGTNRVTLVLGGPLGEAWDLIIVPLICLGNSWIKGDEVVREWDSECWTQLRAARVSGLTPSAHFRSGLFLVFSRRPLCEFPGLACASAVFFHCCIKKKKKLCLKINAEFESQCTAGIHHALTASPED